MLIGVSINAQIGINTVDPKATLDITNSSSSTSPNGLLIPRMTAAELEANITDYGEAQNGALIFITEGTGTLPETSSIQKKGFYHYDSAINRWSLNDTEPWLSKETNSPAVNNFQDIYQTGAVGIGGSNIDESAQLDISSISKGILIPRLTTTQRNALNNDAANGLIIFNITTNCINYWQKNIGQWLSLCGGYDPAEYNVIDCTAPTGPSTTLMQGKGLTANDKYIIKINVTKIGTYTILATTTNGYSYSKTGVFTETGMQTIELEGQGTPGRPTTGVLDSVNLKFNGIDATPNCTLPGVEVMPAATTFNINCSSPVIAGEYKNFISMNGDNYVEFDITSITTGGSIIINCNSNNNVTFSSNSITITSGVTTKLRLYAQGTPSNTGTFTYNLEIPGNPSTQYCSFQITYENSVGTFENPATSCKNILDITSSSPDGYYWIKYGVSDIQKTYCDMTNGGWTLISSQSESQLMSTTYTNYSNQLSYYTAINTVNNQTAIFNEYNFRLPKNAIEGINKTASSSNPIQLRYTIKEKGHTGTTLAQVESSTVAPINDYWSMENYYVINIYGGNPFNTGWYYGIGNSTIEGKIFNLPFSKPTPNSLQTSFNGYIGSGAYGFYSEFYTGFYGTRGMAGSTSQFNTYTYPAPNNDKTFVYSRYDINDLFGLYPVEVQINHHIGTCNPIGDDYGGNSSCTSSIYWTNMRPHSFNNNQGRILQAWTK